MYLHDCRSLNAFGDEQAAAAALCAGRSALALHPVLGEPLHRQSHASQMQETASPTHPDANPTQANTNLAQAQTSPTQANTSPMQPDAPEQAPGGSGDSVPLALIGAMDTRPLPPRWWQPLLDFAEPLRGKGWGSRSQPIFITGSNYGVDNLYAIAQDGDHRRAPWGAQHSLVGKLRAHFGWGRNVTTLSHACVSAQLGLLLAQRALQDPQTQRALIFSFDFLSPFVTGGFHALKILNSQFPQPYLRRQTGSIGLGDGAAWAILSREPSANRILGQSVFNEMHHFTANAADGSGFRKVLEPLHPLARGRRLLIKGHGTGTLEAGELEVSACAEAFGQHTPLVSWKGGLGHTLGSCALVELAILVAARRKGIIPPTVFAEPPQAEPFGANVATRALEAHAFDATLLLSNAFGGAHAAMLLAHE